VITNNIVNSSVTNQGTGYSSTSYSVYYNSSANVQVTSEIDTSTRSIISVTNITAGGLMNITGRAIASLYVNTTTSSVIEANLTIIATDGSTTTPLAWANTRQTVGAGSTTTIPQPAGELELLQANYPFPISSNVTVTIYGLLKGRVISGNAKILGSFFDNYSPSTQSNQLRYTTGLLFKR
jgi:hypothetical protein